MVTVSHTHNLANRYVPRSNGQASWQWDNYFHCRNFSLSLTHTLVTQARRPRGTTDACRTRASRHTVAQAGGRVWRSSDGLRLQSEWKGIGERRKAGAVRPPFFFALSVSLSVSLSLSLARRKLTWTPVRLAHPQSSRSNAAGAHPLPAARRAARPAPVAAKTFTAQHSPW